MILTKKEQRTKKEHMLNELLSPEINKTVSMMPKVALKSSETSRVACPNKSALSAKSQMLLRVRSRAVSKHSYKTAK